MGAARRRLNDYLVLLHMSAGITLLAFSVDDILNGGPARPTIIPVLGAYMSASVVFYAVLKDKSPTVLVWINGLSDAVLIIAAQRLAYIDFVDLGPDLSVALLVAIVALTYSVAGLRRLSVAIGFIVTVFFIFTLVSPTTGYPVLDVRSVAALLLVGASAIGGVSLARAAHRRELSCSIHRLERLEAAVAFHRLDTAPGTAVAAS